jgi:hypothetical protein
MVDMVSATASVGDGRTSSSAPLDIWLLMVARFHSQFRNSACTKKILLFFICLIILWCFFLSFKMIDKLNVLYNAYKEVF